MRRFDQFAVLGLAATLLTLSPAVTGGCEGEAAVSRSTAPIALGVFLPESGPLAGTAEEVSRGIAVAVARANDSGGIDGRPVRIVAASSDRPWEGASAELVRLIYDDGAAAIIGAVDGRSAHLAEQVITRARGAAVFITPWVSESTLTRIRVPWFFRLVPDDRQQAEVLARELFVERRLTSVAVWVGGDFDARSAARALRRAAPAGAIEEFGESLESAATLQRLRGRVAAGAVEGVVIFALPEAAGAVVAALRDAGSVPPLFGPLHLASGVFLDALMGSDADIALIAPGEIDMERFGFERSYRNAHGSAPALAALYGHDAATAVIAAMRVAGTDGGDRIAAALNGIDLQGVTGEVRFNDQGGRDLMPAITTARRAVPIENRAIGDAAER